MYKSGSAARQIEAASDYHYYTIPLRQIHLSFQKKRRNPISLDFVFSNHAEGGT